MTMVAGLAQLVDESIRISDDSLLLLAALFGLGQEGQEARAVQVRDLFINKVVTNHLAAEHGRLATWPRIDRPVHSIDLGRRTGCC